MISTTLSLLTSALLGCGFGHHGTLRSAVVEVTCCDDSFEVARLIATLQACPNWRTRDDAAHDMRDHDWRAHPEILPALTSAMLADSKDEVREEAAETLTKINPPPCVPEVHAALARSAECEPDWCTRKWARRGLARVARNCSGPCDVCEAQPTQYVSNRPGVVFGRFLLPRNGAFMVPGSRLRMPVEVPSAEPSLVPPNEGETIVVPSDADRADPLRDLPRIEALPDPSLPQPLDVDPRNTPPPAQEASPFIAPPRAEKPRTNRFASRDRDDPKPERIAERKTEDHKPEPRRGLFRTGLFQRRGR